MRLSYIIASAAGLMVALGSCTKDLDTYSGESGIYFNYRINGGELQTDTVTVTWGSEASDVKEQDLKLKVILFGNAAPYDRSFDIKVETQIMPYGSDVPTGIVDENGDEIMQTYTLDAKEGVDFELPASTYVLPAGKAEVEIPIRLKRRDGLDAANRAFKVSLVENNQLKFLFTRYMAVFNEAGGTEGYALDYQRVIVQSDIFPMPRWWSYRGQSVFGTWSSKKAALICDVCGIDRNEWLDDVALGDGYLRFCGRRVHLYLQENPQYEDDGSLMTMGESSTY